MVRVLQHIAVAILAVWGGAAAAADLVTTLREDGRFDRFAQAVSAVDPGAGGAPVTVFAPTDEAFRRLPDALSEDLFDAVSRERLKRIVALHVVPSGPFPSDEVPVEMTSAGGTRIVATATRGALTLRPSPEGAGGDDALATRAANEARVLFGDIRSDNAVVHALDAVLLPPDLDDAAADAGGAPGETGEDLVGAVIDADADRPDDDALRRSVEAAGREDRAETDIAMPPEPTTDRRLAAVRDATIVTLPPDEAAAPGLPDEPQAAQAGAAGEDGAAGPDPRAETAADDAAAEAEEKPGGLGLTRQLVSLGDLMDADVTDETGAAVGRVEDVLLALDTGRATRLVIEVDSGLFDLFGETNEIDVRDAAIDPLSGNVVVPRSALESAGD